MAIPLSDEFLNNPGNLRALFDPYCSEWEGMPVDEKLIILLHFLSKGIPVALVHKYFRYHWGKFHYYVSSDFMLKNSLYGLLNLLKASEKVEPESDLSFSIYEAIEKFEVYEVDPFFLKI